VPKTHFAIAKAIAKLLLEEVARTECAKRGCKCRTHPIGKIDVKVKTELQETTD